MKVIIINNNIKTLHIYYTTYLTYKIIGIIIKKNFFIIFKIALKMTGSKKWTRVAQVILDRLPIWKIKTKQIINLYDCSYVWY